MLDRFLEGRGGGDKHDSTHSNSQSGHPDFALSAPTPELFIPLLYITGLAGAVERLLEVLVDGYAFGSLSMASYTLDVKCPTEKDRRPSAVLPDPALVPPENTNV